MNYWLRVALAAGIIMLDLVVFVAPLYGIFLAYVILYNPSWFRSFLERLDKPPQT